MSYSAKPDEIGQYLDDLITRKYGSRKAFSRKFLDKLGKTDEDTQNTENRFYKIVKGTNEIPAYDLLLTSELLDVSCEEILSAGKLRFPTSAHITNYDIACSDDPSLWKQYLDHGCTLYLDEFKKSVIDYAFEKKNIKLFKYMIEEDIIWLIADKESDNKYGTDLFEVDYKKESNMNNSFWESNIRKEDRLRTKIIILAIENGNVEVLDMLRARSTSAIEYIISRPEYNTNHVEVTEEFLNSVIDAVALCESDAVLDYFSAEYMIEKENSIVVCPFYSRIIETMIENKRYDHAEIYIKRAIAHNKKIYETVKNILDNEFHSKCLETNTKKKEAMMQCYSNGCSFEEYARCFPTEEEIMCSVMRWIRYEKKHNIIFCRKPDTYEWIISNLIYLNELKGPEHIKSLIREMNEWIDKFVSMNERNCC